MVRAVIERPGEPLDAPTRRHMETRLGHDFGHVRVHRDAAAARSVAAVSARAYAVGHHLAFAAGEYAPTSAAGGWLLAHELAHTVATSNADSAPPAALRLGAHDDASERAANAAADGQRISQQPTAEAGVVRRNPPASGADAEPPSMGAKTSALSSCRIHFKQGGAELTSTKQFDGCMKAARAYLQGEPSGEVLLYGFANDEGGPERNLTLSKERAQTIAKLFGQGGVDKARTRWFGYGADATHPRVEDNRRVEVVLLAQQSSSGVRVEGTRPGPVPAVIINNREGGTAEEQLEASIASAASVGLPVKFLRVVQKNYSVDIVDSDDDNRTDTVFDELEFRPGVLMRNLDTTNPGMSPEFGTLYHEATHAYLEDLMSDVEPFASARENAKSHYRHAEVGDQGQTTTDPSRLAAEAAGEYVDHRIKTWWNAYTSLTRLASKTKLTAEALEKVRKTYNEAMKKDNFGYSEEGGEQLHTSRGMDPALKRVIDERLLEGKIPSTFDQVIAFANIVTAAKAKNQL
jgi:outer membrane protein OmpA-like peptidoglycan-associated protein